MDADVVKDRCSAASTPVPVELASFLVAKGSLAIGNTTGREEIVSTASAIEAGCYVYGIIDAQDGLSVSLPGIDGGEIETIEADGIAAVVTRVARQKIRPQRANLAVHHKLLLELVQRQAVIPCAFGMVASSEEQLHEVLLAHRTELQRQLARFRGKVEMGLSVYWNTSNIFEFFVAANEELRQMRDQMFRLGREPSMEERLELGKRFESLLRQCRERHTQQVIAALSPCCAEIRAVDPGAEQMIMKLVCLVPKDRLSQFEEGIQEAARKFDEQYCFKYSGPWAPFDFVDVTMDVP
jgi:hypothetical protein